MDLRRLKSSSLAETTSDGHNPAAGQLDASSPYGSPKAQNARLPGLWKNLKAKLGSMTTSRSANNLQALQHGPALVPTQVVEAETSCSAHVRAGQSQHLFSPVGSPAQSAFVQPGSITTADSISKPGALEKSATSSPVAIEQSTSVLSTESDSVPERPVSPVRKAPELRSATRRDDGTAAGAPQTIHRKLLALSPALPPAMNRSVWSLDDYAISRRLFKGSSSAVYKATCRRSGLPVALKVYFLSRVPANVVHMLKREIEIHSQLVHRHVVRLYGAFMDDRERVVLVQEFAGQGDLYGAMQRLGGRMRPEQVANTVVRPFLEALSYLHSRGICHRDIKPENILFTQSWRLLIADFGVSIDLNQERAVTRAGTEGYMAPEVERCPLKAEPEENKDDPRYHYSTAVDIWALGVLTYELMVGFPPVVMSGAAAGNAEFVRSQMTAAALHFPASVPPVARAFVATALAADPLERPTALQLLQHPWLKQPAPVPVPEQ